MPDTATIAELLCCPITRQSLDFREGPIQWRWGAWQTLAERYLLGNLIGVLETSDGSIAYPVWADVFGLLPEMARLDDGNAQLSEGQGLQSEKRSVANFYDEFGWIQVDGNFNDAKAFEDLREMTAFYRTRCHRRVNKFLTGGRYLLDVASGPVQIPEYKSFSDGYAKRICVDISIAGLLQAKQRLGDHAVCIVGDITALPLRAAVVDSFVSLHTIYHVPADEQSKAVSELYRVTKPRSTGVIVYSWGPKALLCRALARVQRWIPKPSRNATNTPAFPANLDLYFSPHDYAWYQREIARPYRTKLRIWRSLEKESLEFFIRGKVSARLLLWPLYALEQLFPWLFGRIGVCPMFVLTKPASAPSTE